MTNLSPYSLAQSVFMINLAANALFDEVGAQLVLQEKLSAFLGGFHPGAKPGQLRQGPFFKTLNAPDPNYPCLALAEGNQGPGDWGVVWGPAVVQVPPDLGATNVMYVAASASLKTYVVAIAGTNPTGWTAGTIEDCRVAPGDLSLWPPQIDNSKTQPQLLWQPAKATADNVPCAVSGGTAFGLGKLFGMTWPYGEEDGVTLQQFLDSVASADNTLVFTGHSLGGALAPSLAMLLYPQAAQTPKCGWGTIRILASAGPTPGTPSFAELFFTPAAPPAVAGPKPVEVSNPPPPPPQASGPYAPVATNAATSGHGDWEPLYWNMNYANVFDIVPRAWYGLAGLVVAPEGQGANYQSFFAGGADLSANDAGPVTAKLLTYLTNKVGYNGDQTPYYAPCLLQSPFNGAWGRWSTNDTYPSLWVGDQPPQLLQTFAQAFDWALNAHLVQYPYSLLGYPCPTIKELSPLSLEQA